MKLTRIKIENYRSIKLLDFEPNDFVALIGENNTGKTNILRAINIILGETWPSERSFSEEDFYNKDTDQTIKISIWFDTPISYDRYGHTVEVKGFSLEYKKYVRGQKKGEYHTEFRAIDENGEPVKVLKEPFTKGKKAQFVPLSISGDLRERVPLIYIDVDRDYSRHQPTSKWTLLGKIFQEVNIDFGRKDNVVSIDGLTITRKEAYTKKLDEAITYLRTDLFNQVETRIKESVLEQLGLKQEEKEEKIKIRFDTHDAINFYRTLQLIVNEDGIDFPATEMGAGLQSSIVVAIFRAYRELKREGAIICIEEPEIFLHPHTAKYFYQLLKAISEEGNQIFYATHSPIFVDISNYQNVFLIRKNSNKGTYICKAINLDITSNSKEELKLLTQFDPTRNELFFAKKVLLVEGPTEKYSFPFIFGLCGVNINQKGISIIETGGKTNMPVFIKILEAFNIPYIVVHDKDSGDVEEKRNREIQQYASNKDNIIVLTPDFPTVANLSKDDVRTAREKFGSIKKKEDIPKPLIAVVEKLQNI